MRHPNLKILLSVLFILTACYTKALNPDDRYKLSGRIVEAISGKPVSGATINIEGMYLWAVSDQNGNFSIDVLDGGNYTLRVSQLEYVPTAIPVSVAGDVSGLKIRLELNTLAIDEVVVTAKTSENNLNTTLIIGGTALEHMQVSNVADISALLPGGKTKNPDLTADNYFSLRNGGTNEGNARFATAVEVDGVRMGNNGSFDALEGANTKSIATANIESVEVITGVPSAEYGDLNSGMVRINTKKGRTPWQVLFSANPRTQQVSASKGFDLGGNRGVINAGGEWTKATRSLTSPYSSYKRRGFSLNYHNTFRKALKFDFGVAGNFGGMNTKDDPDAYSGEFTKVRDNVLRANVSMTWMLNKTWITNLKFDGSVYYNDNRSHERTYNSSSSELPAVHATEEGYFFATRLPQTYFANKVTDSKELDYAASLKYEWTRRIGSAQSNLKAGVQWKATGNVGDGEYYQDPALAANGYRPRPYNNYPYMHNTAAYAEENLSMPIGTTQLELMAGVRFESLRIRNTEYRNLKTFSPRFNLRWRINEIFAVRGGWGVTEKLPSYYALYPRQEYRDVQTFGFSYGNSTQYIYHTQPYTVLHNRDLKWQRNYNSEIGVDVDIENIKIMLVGYYNKTKRPYRYSNSYTPYSYNMMTLPSGFTMPDNPELKLDNQTGELYVRESSSDYWTAMDVSENQTFVRSTTPDNGATITRKGLELIVDFPEIKPIRTQIRFDAAYGYSKYIDNSLSYYYNTGWSHTSIANRSYEFVGIYATGNSSSVTANGRRESSIDANFTTITHIPSARVIISVRVEMSLMKRMQNLSEHNGREYAFNVVSEEDRSPAGGSIYNGNSYTAVRPVAYMDLDGNIHPFTDAEAADSRFSGLIRTSGNAYTFKRDGYDPFVFTNINITKEIGDHVSVSFFANNFTSAKRYMTSHATGISAIVEAFSPPKFYYGITCRLKL